MATVHEARRKFSESPENDFYQTPKCITRELVNNYLRDMPRGISIYDPCCGLHAIGDVLRESGFADIAEADLIYGQDFFAAEARRCDCIVMNPPFRDFDAFVEKAKREAPIVCSIGRLNYFGAHNRNVSGLWEHLKYVLVFDRQIAYDRPFREDGKVECGMMISCWFIWDRDYSGDPAIKVVDVQKYIVTKKEAAENV